MINMKDGGVYSMNTLAKTLMTGLLLTVSAFAGASPLSKVQEDVAQHIFKQSFKQHVYIADHDQYGVNEKWVASLHGDCEDFALYVRKQLQQEHINSELWIVRTEKGELHVVLRIDTVDGEKVADNRYNKIIDRGVLDYKWIAKVSDAVLEKY